MATTMGQIIKRLRKGRGLTQEELAQRIGVTYQAVSKWENDYGMPDISQIVPLASVFDVSTDVLFGIDRTTEFEEALKIVSAADAVKEYGKLETYLNAYNILTDGLKKYPNNLMIMNNCMSLGVALAMPENGWIYAKNRADSIISETIRQANFIIANSKNITDILRARQCLVFLYSANKKFDLATVEARNFPVRTDFTLYSNMARVNEYMGDYAREATYLCSDIDYSLQAFEDNTARLGAAYYNSGKYTDAIEVYEIFFAVMHAIFKDECPPPYHDFDSGDCYLLLAKSYLAIGKENKAMDAVEKSVLYYVNLFNKHKNDRIDLRKLMTNSPLVCKTEVPSYICRDTIKQKLLEKLKDKAIQPLCKNERFTELYKIVTGLSD
ncbi:MAG: helix-turn-helix domain-containing protein [Ruminococcaceae bacterium]|nr:helix-turn-helix domain-containing protein [Oscillospiraceae bacterium]